MRPAAPIRYLKTCYNVNDPIKTRQMKKLLLIGGPGSVIGAQLLEILCEKEYRIAATFFSGDYREQYATRKNISLYPLDISRENEVESLIRKVEQELGGIDILINNAGIFRGKLMALTNPEQWKQVLDVNLTGVFFTCKSVTREMMKRKKGKIINIASSKGMKGGAGESAYSASKAGVIALTKSMARELAGHHITVNAVCPGFIPSRLNRHSENARINAQKESLMDIDHNLNDAVHFIRFLCSSQLQSVTGQVFYIDSRVD